MRTNKLKAVRTLFINVLMYYMISIANAASVSGGDVSQELDADVVVDIVFAIDTSFSMGDEARKISNAIQSALTNMECTDIDVWVNARLVGLRGTWRGTLFNERASSVLASVGAGITINHSEDNGPVVFDFARANSAYYIDTTASNQGYAKAIVTIGDEGLQNGASVNQHDYNIGKAANEIAIENNILVFSLLGNRPTSNAPALFKALAEGENTLGGHVFNDTGGTFTTTSATTPFEEVLEDVFCRSAQTLLRNVRVVSVLSTNDIDLDSSSFAQPPYGVEIRGNETFIEWRFPSIFIGQVENLDYDVVLHNPEPDENRLVTRQLDVYYTDLNGNEVHSGLGSQFVNVFPSIFNLTVDTNQPSYTSHENVQIATQISNLSQYDQLVDIKVSVQDIAGNLVKEFDLIQGIALQTGETWSDSSFSFATGKSFEGSYQIHTQLLDQNGNEIVLATVPILIVTPNEAKVSGTITTDKSSYEAFDTINIFSRIQNVTPNALLEGYTAITTIYTPDNIELWATNTTLPQLLPLSLKDLNETITLNAAMAGNYRVVQEIKDETGTEDSKSVTTFQVLSSSVTGSGLSGTLSIIPNPVLKTETLTIDAVVNNIGNSVFDNLPLTLSIIDPAKETVLAEWTQTLSQLQMQQVKDLTVHTLQAEGKVGEIYLAILSTQLNGATKYLARAPFMLEEKLLNQFQIGETGRILILLDPLPHNDVQGNQGFESNAELTQQRQYLEALLQENNWRYTIVTDKDSFASELRSRAYTQYALFAAREKLDEQVQKELREAIYNGAGLIQAGDHDQRYNQLDEALGTRVSGKHNNISGIDLLDTDWLLTGATDWYPDDKPLKAELLESAEAMAYYLGQNIAPDSGLAIARNSYGLGRSVFMGLDILAHASIDGADTLFSELLLTALAEIMPKVKPEYDTLEPVPVELSLTNQGTDSALRTIFTFPEGTEMIDSGKVQPSDQGAWQWPITLLTGETAVETLWVRLPDTTVEPIAINARIEIEVNGQWQTYATRDLIIALLPSPEINDLVDSLQALEGNAYNPVVQAISKATTAGQQGDDAQAIKFLIQASDSLIRIQTQDAEELRLQLDRLITRLSMNL